MDAEHRHELKTNELAAWISDLPEMVKKNMNIIIGLTLIVIGLITWPMLNRASRAKDLTVQTQTTESIQMMERDIIAAVTQSADPQARQDALSKLLINADALLQKADELDNPNLAAMARIKGAQAIRTELQLRSEEVPADAIETQIKKASEAYEKALKQATDPQVKAMAQFGLGLCSEELGQTDQASQIYNEIIKNEAYASTVIPAQAQQRLDVLQEKVGSVYFAPAPVVEMPAAVDTNAPAAAPATEAAPVIEPAPAERQSQAEAQEAPTAPAQQPAQAPAPAEKPAQPVAPAPEQKAASNE